MRAWAETNPLIFEGAQGVLLDEWRGFHPYTTWSTTTDRNAKEILGDLHYTGPIKTLGVIRAYQTRHGAGPFPTETTDIASTCRDEHNGVSRWQGQFRVGWPDHVLTRYAIGCCLHVDGLVMTHLDQWKKLEADLGAKRSQACVAYQYPDRKSVV